MHDIDKIFSDLIERLHTLLYKTICDVCGDVNVFSKREFNPYDILGVNDDASDDEIDARYKYLMKHLHPDVCPGMKILPTLINIAYTEIKRQRKA